MNIKDNLIARSGGVCELTGQGNNLEVYLVEPKTTETLEHCVLVCADYLEQLEGQTALDANLWRCLSDSMWNNQPSVQVVVWRLLHRLQSEDWAKDLLDSMYLDEETLAWAQSTTQVTTVHMDSNGNILQNGDTVTLTKDLNVKGANFTAKRGTAVRKIMLVEDDPTQIEGKVNDQRIVILTKFVKKV